MLFGGQGVDQADIRKNDVSMLCGNDKPVSNQINGLKLETRASGILRRGNIRGRYSSLTSPPPSRPGSRSLCSADEVPR